MKNFTYVLALFISITLISCGDDAESGPSFILSNENIAGNYTISNLSISTDITTTTNGFPVKVATASTEGDLFKVDVEMFANGTYSMIGSYTTVYKLTPVVGNAVETRDIITINNSGNFTIDTANNTITFSGDLIKNLTGTLKVEVFNQNSFSLFQEIDVPTNGNVEKISTDIGFTRK